MNVRAFRNPAFISAMAVLLIAGVGMSSAIRYFNIYLRKMEVYARDARAVRALPVETDRWKRIDVDKVESEEVLAELGTKNYVSRVYAAKNIPAGDPPRYVDFHAAYYTGMIDTVPHVPERCFVGGGMQIAREWGEMAVPLDASMWAPDPRSEGDPRGVVYTTRLPNIWSDRGGQRVALPRGVTPEGGLKIRVTEFSDPKGNHVFAGYFFIANGGTTASAESVRLLAFNMQDDYAYYLKVQVTSGAVKTGDELAALAGDLLDDLFGEIMRCAPDWTEVERGEWPEDNPRRAKAAGG